MTNRLLESAQKVLINLRCVSSDPRSKIQVESHVLVGVSEAIEQDYWLWGRKRRRCRPSRQPILVALKGIFTPSIMPTGLSNMVEDWHFSLRQLRRPDADAILFNRTRTSGLSSDVDSSRAMDQSRDVVSIHRWAYKESSAPASDSSWKVPASQSNFSHNRRVFESKFGPSRVIRTCALYYLPPG